MTDYQLRYSKRAKHLQLRISYRGLEVIVPVKKKFNAELIAQFIQQKQDWITRNQQKFNIKPAENILPAEISLNAIPEHWFIKYYATNQPKLSLHANESKEITLMGTVADHKSCIKQLKNWLAEKATVHLPSMLKIISLETGLDYKKVSIRNNTTRWGSCSGNNNISLCCKLMFMPPPLVKHVLLHELCHTKVKNHGRNFWKLLQHFDNNAEEHAKQLRKATALVPAWMR